MDFWVHPVVEKPHCYHALLDRNNYKKVKYQCWAQTIMHTHLQQRWEEELDTCPWGFDLLNHNGNGWTTQISSNFPYSLWFYLQQDIALVNELSIKETIYYFGRIYGMHDDRIRERFKILKDLLELPDSSRLVENLSGGQKRRVSFACALVHGNSFALHNVQAFGWFNCFNWILFVTMLLQNRSWSYWMSPQLDWILYSGKSELEFS